MIENAPVWINEILVNILTVFMKCMMFVCPISLTLIIATIAKLTIGRKNIKKKIIDLLKVPISICVIVGLIISLLAFGLFYFPQKVLSNTSRISSVIILTDVFSPDANKVIINDTKSLNELKSIFSKYKCRRSLDKEKAIQDKSTPSKINLHMLVVTKNKTYPQHFLIGKDYSIVYISENTDFIYLIKDNNHELERKLNTFIQKITH